MRTHARSRRNGYRRHTSHVRLRMQVSRTVVEIEERQQQIKKITERLKKEQEEMEPQREWLYRCVSKVPFPPIMGRPRLSFGLAGFLIYVRERFVQHGDQDAAATLRVLRPRPMHKMKRGKLLQ